MSRWIGDRRAGDHSTSTADATADPTVGELRSYGRALVPSPATLQRIRGRAHDDYLVRRAVSVGNTPSLQQTFIGRRIPLILTAITILAAMFGDIAVCNGLSVFGFGTLVTRAPALLGAPFTGIGLLVLACGTLELALAFGLWKRRSWAWSLGVAVEAAMLLLALTWILAGAFVLLQALRACVSFVILAFLDRREVRAALSLSRPVGALAT